MTTIPAIDLIDGKCVRLTKGDYATTKTYNANPLEQAKIFEGKGYTNLHLVDLTGAKQGKPVHLNVLEQISTKTSLKVDFGGGIRTIDSATAAINQGASQVNIGTALIDNKDMVTQLLALLGASKIVAAIDVEKEQVKIAGWLKNTGVSIYETVSSLSNKGLIYFAITDIERDGMLTQPSLGLYSAILAQFTSIKLRASGGVTSAEHLKQLEELGCEGAIVGKALYEGYL
ncbi:MAG TPA: 1-(5-phosphoribosyl)-5-[(5-phosphoribosylamino)methylideneamino] imidazole-4-carboxamide isomerase [Tenuifilaceae bacterium]|nr:1-(5-phosphoribosyl)-5-[(5-phosphoribosylamino)methylideneamino] imidazole-4-carboxamide isomerase [Tenuifilaceae bacterium]HQB78846.1 1-(5-phosphoribosyl)-5-[(5-phosphoribosylamino)methylideneamino] imidazole-4-carboxamide isomerase [Tenuifilaceae bacterium]